MSELSLVDFLLARLDEDERHARKLLETDTRPVLSLAVTVNHPARVLVEVESKRRIVNRARAWLDEEPDSTVADTVARDILGHVVRALASVYADHEDYRAEEWA